MQVAPLDSASQTADDQSEKDSVTHGAKCDVASPNSENDDQSDTQSNDNQSGSECSMLRPPELNSVASEFVSVLTCESVEGDGANHLSPLTKNVVSQSDCFKEILNSIDSWLDAFMAEPMRDPVSLHRCHSMGYQRGKERGNGASSGCLRQGVATDPLHDEAPAPLHHMTPQPVFEPPVLEGGDYPLRVNMLRANPLPPPNCPLIEGTADQGETGGEVVLPRGFPLLREPAFEVGPQGDLQPIYVQINNMQYYFSSRTPDDFREISAMHFKKIYTDMNSMTEQIKYIVEHEQVLHARWQQVAPFTLQLRADTEKFAQDICTVLAQHENKFQLAARDFAALIAEVKKLIDSIPSPQTVADQQQVLQSLGEVNRCITGTRGELLSVKSKFEKVQTDLGAVTVQSQTAYDTV